MSFIKETLYPMVAPVLRKLLGNRMVDKPISGSALRLYYNRSQHLGFLFQSEITYEKELSLIILNMIDKGSLVFEIGSNIGQYSLLIADKLGNSGKLICVEPDSDNLKFLSHNVLKNNLSNVTTIHAAVSDEEGVAEFFKDTVTGGRMGTLFKEYAGSHFQGKSEKVPTITLEKLIRTYGVPDFVKVDVEGAEDRVFFNSEYINQNTKYLIEVREETKHQIFTTFNDLGFSVYLPEHNMVRVNDSKDIPGFANLIIKANH